MFLVCIVQDIVIVTVVLNSLLGKGIKPKESVYSRPCRDNPRSI